MKKTTPWMNLKDDDDKEKEEEDEDPNNDDDGCEVLLHEFGQLRWMFYKGNGSLGAAATIVRGHTI